MGRSLKFISQAEELAGIQKLIYNFNRFYPDFVDERTLMLMVSPDFSGIVTTIMSQGISKPEHDLIYVDCIHVPDPDEEPKLFVERFKSDWKNIQRGFETKPYNKFILVEAGVISGRNYSWLSEMMVEQMSVVPENILTVALYESIKSEFKCDLVSNYYNHKKEDLCFWWEVPNPAFGDYSEEMSNQ